MSMEFPYSGHPMDRLGASFLHAVGPIAAEVPALVPWTQAIDD
jgi:hypothetical protein